MTLLMWLCLATGIGIGASWQYVRPSGVLDLRVRLKDAYHQIWRYSDHPAGRKLSNVVPLPRGPQRLPMKWE